MINWAQNQFKSLANPYCADCRGTGYIGTFKHICNGRCFQCIPDHRWNQLILEN